MKCNSLPSHVADAIDVVEELCLSADLCHHLPWNLLEKGMCITCAHNNNVWTGVCLLLQSQYGYPRASLLLRNGTRISASTVTRGRKLLLQDTSVCLCVFFLRFAWDQRLRFLSHQIQVFRAYKQAPDVDTDPGGTAREMYSREPDTEGRRGSEHREKVLCWLPLKLDEHLCVTDGFVSSLWFFYLRVPCDEPSGIWALEVSRARCSAEASEGRHCMPLRGVRSISVRFCRFCAGCLWIWMSICGVALASQQPWHNLQRCCLSRPPQAPLSCPARRESVVVAETATPCDSSSGCWLGPNSVQAAEVTASARDAGGPESFTPRHFRPLWAAAELPPLQAAAFSRARSWDDNGPLQTLVRGNFCSRGGAYGTAISSKTVWFRSENVEPGLNQPLFLFLEIVGPVHQARKKGNMNQRTWGLQG
ncbi:uncharacterized protein LOC142048476 isoform X5 [Phalacrocorax aristotelis]|uniref:uncharacterized protein LOC142048476 isoform X5 n=1 Tax=Phalacrocorax aristotelis TaxID=126867 RepID=UPI003F4BBBF4